MSWRQIARSLGVSAGSVRRAGQLPRSESEPCQNPTAEVL
jgi:hypothetical protein